MREPAGSRFFGASSIFSMEDIILSQLGNGFLPSASFRAPQKETRTTIHMRATHPSGRHISPTGKKPQDAKHITRAREHLQENDESPPSSCPDDFSIFVPHSSYPILSLGLFFSRLCTKKVAIEFLFLSSVRIWRRHGMAWARARARGRERAFTETSGNVAFFSL